MALIEVNTLGQAIKKYTLIYTLGTLTGIGLGYKMFSDKQTTIIEPKPKITIPLYEQKTSKYLNYNTFKIISDEQSHRNNTKQKS